MAVLLLSGATATAGEADLAIPDLHKHGSFTVFGKETARLSASARMERFRSSILLRRESRNASRSIPAESSGSVSGVEERLGALIQKPKRSRNFSYLDRNRAPTLLASIVIT